MRNVLLLLTVAAASIAACTNDYGQFRFPAEPAAAGAPSTGGNPDATGGSLDATGGSPDATGGSPGVTGGSAGAN